MGFYNSISFLVIALGTVFLWTHLARLSFIPLFVKQIALLALNLFILYNLAGLRGVQLGIIMGMALFACAWAKLIMIVRDAFPCQRIVPKLMCGAAVISILGALCVFKFQPAANLVAPLLSAPILFDEGDLSRRLIRFIGISYAVFKMLQIVIDAARGMLRDLSPLTALNFAAFFPVFISGPILRYNDFADDIARISSHRLSDRLPCGLYRLAAGLIKTLLISPFLFEISISNIPDPVLLQMTWYKALIVMYAYGLYIYLDFSGYCDMAIGLGALMGFRVPENFGNPFLSRNIQEF